VSTLLTIAGVDRTTLIRDQDAIELDPQANARGTARVTLLDRTGSGYRPAFGDTFEVTLDGDLTFGGIVMTVTESIQASDRLRIIEVAGPDYTVLLDRQPFNGIAGTVGSTLRDVVDALIVNLVPYGVTRDPSMAPGPTIGPQGYDFATIRACFKALSTLTGYAFRMDPAKVIYWAGPSSLTAPFDLDASNVFDDEITVRRDGGQYANGVWLQFGAPGVQTITVTLHGDGSTRLFPIGYPVVAPPATVTVNGVVKPVGIYGVDTHPPLDYFYREVDPFFPYAIIQDPSQPVLTSGDDMVLTPSVQFPGAVFESNGAEILARGAWTIVERDQTIFDIATARLTAQGILRRRLALPAEVTASTRVRGLSPLMGPNITWPSLGLSGNFLVTTSRPQRVTAARGRGTDEFWKFQHTLIEGNEFKGNWIDYFLDIEGGGGDGGGSVNATIAGGITPGFIAYAEWGGARLTGISGTAAWVDVREWRDVVLSADAHVSVRVDRKTENSSVSVKARVYDYTAGAAAITGASTTSTGWSEEILSFDGFAGHRYRLQVQPGTSSNDHEVFVVGTGA
jgi:hypothetical protein